MSSIGTLIDFGLEIVWYLVIAHALMSWLIGMQVLNVRSPLIGQIWKSLDQLLDPAYSRIRSILPNTGMIDFSPLVLIFGIYFLRILLANNL